MAMLVTSATVKEKPRQSHAKTKDLYICSLHVPSPSDLEQSVSQPGQCILCWVAPHQEQQATNSHILGQVFAGQVMS